MSLFGKPTFQIYSKKKSWKAFLLFIASFIVLVSLWFTNGFIQKLAQNEKYQVELWAKAIGRKANLVNYTEKLFENLRAKERRYVDLWIRATQKLILSDENADIEFFTEVISGNKDIPVIVTDEDGRVSASNNLEAPYDTITVLNKQDGELFTDYPPINVPYFEDQELLIYYKNSNTYYQLKSTLDDLTSSLLDEIVSNNLTTPVIITDSTKTQVIVFGGSLDSAVINNPKKLQQTLHRMENDKLPIEVNLPNQTKNYIFYEESPFLTRLRYFPIVLLSVIGLFLVISYALFSISRKSEQSNVWAGMAKETAHQLGTPISSLMGWIEVMKMNYPHETSFAEMDKDIERLKLVSERFSKIGSKPELKEQNIVAIITEVIDYMQLRAPKKISIQLQNPPQEVVSTKLNPQLIIWVFENLIRNAIDAIGSEAGKIEISIELFEKQIAIDLSDTGKGIPHSQFKTIFNPGYSTKVRGWGLGLSLSKRIIKDYHRGKIFVKSSTLGQGTVFRILLKKSVLSVKNNI
jgi:signal transduction histidine kinase